MSQSISNIHLEQFMKDFNTTIQDIPVKYLYYYTGGGIFIVPSSNSDQNFIKTVLGSPFFDSPNYKIIPAFAIVPTNLGLFSITEE